MSTETVINYSLLISFVCLKPILKRLAPQEVEILQSFSWIADFKLSSVHEHKTHKVETSQRRGIQRVLRNYNALLKQKQRASQTEPN